MIGYNFVLEAKSLIEQHLQSVGKEKYQRSREPKTLVPNGITSNCFSKESEMVLSFGEPMDVLGNRVDTEGNSLDKNCHEVNLREYFPPGRRTGRKMRNENPFTPAFWPTAYSIVTSETTWSCRAISWPT